MYKCTSLAYPLHDTKACPFQKINYSFHWSSIAIGA